MSFNEWLAIAMIASFFLFLAAGVPVALGIALAGFIFGYIGFGDLLFNLLPARIFGVATNYTMMAIPLFVFMGVMLERSKIAEQLLEVIGIAFGGLRGGMALAIVVVGVLMGAATGIVGATVVTLSLLTLPVLTRRGYARSVACGTICASGTLGQIIPPSLVLILLADIMAQSVGTLFAAAMMPGLLLAGLYGAYILVQGIVRPDSMPPIPAAERAEVQGWALVRRLLSVAVPPLALVVAVLGSIVGGVAAPTEAASMGALGSIVIAAAYGRLNRDLVVDVTRTTTKITAMILFILIGAQVFSVAFRGLHGEALIQGMFGLLPGDAQVAIVFMLGLLFVLGFFLEWIEISYIALPMMLPFFTAQHVDMVWLATLVCLVLQTSFLTPPFGWALFFLKGVAPDGVTTRDIYVGVVPFVLLQLSAVVLVFLFPEIATALPRAIGW